MFSSPHLPLLLFTSPLAIPHISFHRDLTNKYDRWEECTDFDEREMRWAIEKKGTFYWMEFLQTLAAMNYPYLANLYCVTLNLIQTKIESDSENTVASPIEGITVRVPLGDTFLEVKLGVTTPLDPGVVIRMPIVKPPQNSKERGGFSRYELSLTSPEVRFDCFFFIFIFSFLFFFIISDIWMHILSCWRKIWIHWMYCPGNRDRHNWLLVSHIFFHFEISLSGSYWFIWQLRSLFEFCSFIWRSGRRLGHVSHHFHRSSSWNLADSCCVLLVDTLFTSIPNNIQTAQSQWQSR